MPTYEYKCKECDNLFEVFQSMKADPVNRCPKCGGEVKKLISAGSGAIFKGSGFYHTDYKNAGNNNSNKNNATEKTVKPSNDSK
jgi:putative FmdB family regulatory protein